MSDRFPDSPDELASAYLDDELTPDERAAVERDPAGRRRVEELRAARDALATAPTDSIDAVARESAIAAALAAAPTDDLAAARAARARTRLRVASIAAAAVILLGVIGLVAASVRDDNTKTFSATAGSIASGPVPEQAIRGAAGGTSAGGGASDATSRRALGAFSDRTSLAAAARDAVAAQPLTSQEGAGAGAAAAPAADSKAQMNAAAAACPPPIPSDGAELLSATAILNDSNVQVDVVQLGDGSREVIVTDPSTCAVLFSQPV